ncbi:MAG: alanine-zipper protein [Nevskiales bacterium]
MTSRVLMTLGAAALVVGMTAGCATNGAVQEVRAMAEAAQSSAAAAQKSAADAQKTANRAQQAAAEAQTGADRAQASADQAAVAAGDANKCCAANTERLDRVFEKSQRK